MNDILNNFQEGFHFKNDKFLPSDLLALRDHGVKSHTGVVHRGIITTREQDCYRPSRQWFILFYSKKLVPLTRKFIIQRSKYVWSTMLRLRWQVNSKIKA